MAQPTQQQQQQPLAATPSPLDQLEAQVNLVLEHTGRIFASGARSQNANVVISNPARLKQVFSGAIDNFHDALDILEEELSIARAVMRRDLAVCRAALEIQTTDIRSEEQTTNEGLNGDTSSDNVRPGTMQDTDVTMTMTGDSPKSLHDSPPQGSFETAVEARSVDQETEGRPGESASDQPEGTSQPREPLQLDIPSGEHQSSENPADAATGTYSNFDFESLFNDPSANPSPNVQPAESPQKPAQPDPAPEPAALDVKPDTEPKPEKPIETIDLDAEQPNNESMNSMNDDAFDFGDLTNFGDSGDMDTGDDNISSLLPGLESYANAPDQPSQSENPADSFNIFDAAGAPDFGATTAVPVDSNVAQASENKPAEPSNAEASGEMPRDDTYDALLDFDNFDMGSFGGGEGDDGKSAFDASFFDIS